MSKNWQVSSYGDFLFAQWDDSDEVVLYYSGSGDTYLISQLGYRILTLLRESAKDRETLIIALASLDTYNDDIYPVPYEMIESHLFHFEKLGLVVS